MHVLLIVMFLIPSIGAACLAAVLAHTRQRNVAGWAFGSFVLPILVVILVQLPPRGAEWIPPSRRHWILTAVLGVLGLVLLEYLSFRLYNAFAPRIWEARFVAKLVGAETVGTAIHSPYHGGGAVDIARGNLVPLFDGAIFGVLVGLLVLKKQPAVTIVMGVLGALLNGAARILRVILCFLYLHAGGSSDASMSVIGALPYRFSWILTLVIAFAVAEQLSRGDRPGRQTRSSASTGRQGPDSETTDPPRDDRSSSACDF